jgi:deazaflavin-dependent oxidoreductase (nitroreductase family)
VPLPGWLARFNRRVTNPALRQVAGRLPYFGVVVHRGRTTGRVYRSPVTAFPYRDGFLIALTYGREVDWVKNVIAQGGCQLILRRRAVDFTRLRVLSLQELQAIPFRGWIQGILQLLRVDEVLHLQLSHLPSGPDGVEHLDRGR